MTRNTLSSRIQAAGQQTTEPQTSLYPQASIFSGVPVSEAKAIEPTKKVQAHDAATSLAEQYANGVIEGDGSAGSSQMQGTMQDYFVTMSFITAYTGLTDKWFYKLIQDGSFPKPIKFGRSSRWLKSEVEAWVQERIQSSRPAAFGQVPS